MNTLIGILTAPYYVVQYIIISHQLKKVEAEIAQRNIGIERKR